MECLGVEPRAAWWKAQTNPLSYGGTPLFGKLLLTNVLTKVAFWAILKTAMDTFWKAFGKFLVTKFLTKVAQVTFWAILKAAMDTFWAILKAAMNSFWAAYVKFWAPFCSNICSHWIFVRRGNFHFCFNRNLPWSYRTASYLAGNLNFTTCLVFFIGHSRHLFNFFKHLNNRL